MQRLSIYTIVIAIFLTLGGCKNQIVDTETKIKEITTPSICPPSSYPEPPAANFAGAKSVDSIEATRFKVHWEASADAAAYLVYLSRPQEPLKIYASAPKESTSMWINALEPDAQYRVAVRLLDERGLHDMNETILNVRTLASSVFQNQKSINFDGFSSVALGASDSVFSSETFSVSLWIKTFHRQNRSEGRLFTAHHGSSASSAFSIGVKDDKVFVAIRDGKGKTRQVEQTFSYHDGNWHHVAATYNGHYLALYINGSQTVKAVDSFSGFGAHPAHIGAYTGLQRGFTGLIDEVSVWSSALGQGRVQELHNAGSAADLFEHSMSVSLAAWYRMGDDQQDDSGRLQDQLERHHGVPLNISSSDFRSEAP